MKTSNVSRLQRSNIVAQRDILPGKMVKIVIGPFRVGETPRITTRLAKVDPPKSVVPMVSRLDDMDNQFRLIYLFQNYGNKTASVTIRRIG